MSVDKVRDLSRVVGELYAQGRLSDAAETARRAVELCRATLGEAHYAWPLTLGALAHCRHALGDKLQARTLVDQAQAAARALGQADFEHARTALTHAAELYAELGDHKEARRLWQDLIQLTGQELGVDHPRYFAAKARLE